MAKRSLPCKARSGCPGPIPTATRPRSGIRDLTFGIYPLSRLLVLLQSFTAVPTGPGTTTLPSSRYSKMELKAAYQLNAAWAVQLGASTTVYGRNALLERGFKTGLWYRF